MIFASYSPPNTSSVDIFRIKIRKESRHFLQLDSRIVSIFNPTPPPESYWTFNLVVPSTILVLPFICWYHTDRSWTNSQQKEYYLVTATTSSLVIHIHPNCEFSPLYTLHLWSTYYNRKRHPRGWTQINRIYSWYPKPSPNYLPTFSLPRGGIPPGTGLAAICFWIALSTLARSLGNRWSCLARCDRITIFDSVYNSFRMARMNYEHNMYEVGTVQFKLTYYQVNWREEK